MVAAVVAAAAVVEVAVVAEVASAAVEVVVVAVDVAFELLFATRDVRKVDMIKRKGDTDRCAVLLDSSSRGLGVPVLDAPAA